MKFKLLLIASLMSTSLTSFADVQVVQKTSTITIQTSAIDIKAQTIIENIDSSLSIINPTLKIGNSGIPISDMQNIAPEGICKFFGKSEDVNSEYKEYTEEREMVSINRDGIFTGYQVSRFAVSFVLCR